MSTGLSFGLELWFDELTTNGLGLNTVGMESPRTDRGSPEANKPLSVYYFALVRESTPV